MQTRHSRPPCRWRAVSRSVPPTADSPGTGLQHPEHTADMRHQVVTNDVTMIKPMNILWWSVKYKKKDMDNTFLEDPINSEDTNRKMVPYTINIVDMADQKWYIYIVLTSEFNLLNAYQLAKKRMEINKKTILISIKSNQSAATLIALWIIVLCNGWEHYVPYRWL